MVTHAEIMALGEQVLTTGFVDEFSLSHLETCTAVVQNMEDACSCGLDAAWTAACVAAADLVNNYAVS